MYIAVSGNLGSGKSTLAAGLSSALSCRLYPLVRSDPSYLNDLFREPKRWSFEAQAAFLANKFRSIADALSDGRLFVLDRSMSEDVEIFCRYFFDNEHMDERSYRTIVDLHSGLSKLVRPPSITLYCRCSPTASRERIAARPPRSYQNLYPADHLARLAGIYREWIKSQTESAVFEIDTEKHDVRDHKTVQRIIQDINDTIDEHVADRQLPLFGPTGHVTKERVAKLQTNTRDRLSELLTVRSRQLRAYLAAPFTALATKPSLSNLDDSLGLSPGIDVIPEGSYRRGLLSLARSVRLWGHEVILPHRDINNWGRNDLPPRELAARCVAAVRRCDAFVGVIRESFGSHVELGVALGAEIPCILIATDDAAMSFFGGAIAESNLVSVVRVPSLNGAARLLKTRDVVREALSGSAGREY